MRVLREAKIAFLVGGAYALGRYTGVIRDTKDFDLFLRERDVAPAVAAFERAGYKAALTFPHWLAKVHHGDAFIDLIFRAGNGLCDVDDGWFTDGTAVELLGEEVQLVPPERMIWQKCYIQERERFDGADVLHLLRETGPSLDWPRLLMRFGDYWRVLFSHIILFGFVYPDKRQNVPTWVMEELTRRLSVSRPNLQSDVCYGTLLSREQFQHDIERWKYRDGREAPDGPMTREQIEIWTDAIGKVK